MKNLFLTVAFVVLSGILFAQDQNPYSFVSPKPGSSLVSNSTNIILRHSGIIDQKALSDDLLTVVGSKSGIHTGELILSDDGKTIVFNPDVAFEIDEVVSVTMGEGLRTGSGNDIPEFSFQYTTSPKPIGKIGISSTVQQANSTSGPNEDLPAPPITIHSIDEPSEGHIFLATWDRTTPEAIYGNFVFILDKAGKIVDSLRVDGAPFDFQVQPNGLLSFALGGFASNVPQAGEELQHIVLDKNLEAVDTFKMKNGYPTDFHEFKMLPNGHVMMMSYYSIIYDMSTIVEGGDPEAELVLNIIQEQDENKNVVFEWRNFDYIPILESDEDLTKGRVNYSTSNAFDIDDDGNILASFRNHSQIAKISRETGELMWRMGGRQNQFTYEGEHSGNELYNGEGTYYHARQHNIIRNPNGNITMFDNGQFHLPPYSRAVEYELDEENKVATLVSEWRYPEEVGNIFTVTAGNAQLLSNGGWFIGFGVPNSNFVTRNAIEVKPDGSIALEFSLPEGVLAYRASKHLWKDEVNIASYTHYEISQGGTYIYEDESNKTGVEIDYVTFDGYGYNESTITRKPYAPINPEFDEGFITIYPVSIIYDGFAIYEHTADIRIDLTLYPEIKDPENTVIYYREIEGEGMFEALSTSYDSENNELGITVGDLGEIVFGVPESEIVDNHPPILIEPLNNEEFLMVDELFVRWTGKGIYDSFNVQFSTDTTFGNVDHEFNTNLSDNSVIELNQNGEYFWRVNSVLGDQISDWSEVRSFILDDPTLSVLEDGISSQPSLGHNFPNPFSSTTQINYRVQTAGSVRLSVHNLLGQEVLSLVNKFQTAGNYSTYFDGSKLPNGLYFYKLQIGNEFVGIKKMQLSR
ncbi:MAG: T9SS type A sorting domain-containing protein [Cytophagales bacterium]|nr:T9SS type A sorting domain-containing protein [Cytophagales bacterium]